MAGEGACPTCGATLPEPSVGDDVGAPWHFKLLMAAVVAYLGWRAVEFVVAVAGRF